VGETSGLESSVVSKVNTQTVASLLREYVRSVSVIELDISRSAAGPCILERFQRKFSEIFLLPGGAVIDIPNDDAGHGAHGYGGRNANIAAKIVETFEQPDTHALLECIPIVAGRNRTPATRHDQSRAITTERRCRQFDLSPANSRRQR
jgi:hypothetical protein